MSGYDALLNVRSSKSPPSAGSPSNMFMKADMLSSLLCSTAEPSMASMAFCIPINWSSRYDCTGRLGEAAVAPVLLREALGLAAEPSLASPSPNMAPRSIVLIPGALDPGNLGRSPWPSSELDEGRLAESDRRFLANHQREEQKDNRIMQSLKKLRKSQELRTDMFG